MSSFIAFKNRLRYLRTNRFLTQEELANKLGLPTQIISKWEQGACEPNINNLIRVATVFQVSIDYIVGRVDKPDQQIETNLRIISEFGSLNEQEKLLILQLIYNLKTSGQKSTPKVDKKPSISIGTDIQKTE